MTDEITLADDECPLHTMADHYRYLRDNMLAHYEMAVYRYLAEVRAGNLDAASMIKVASIDPMWAALEHDQAEMLTDSADSEFERGATKARDLLASKADEISEAYEAAAEEGNKCKNCTSSPTECRTQWQPIETAPKDGTLIFMWVDRPDWKHPEVIKFDEGRWVYADWRLNELAGPFTPTHWMPLPTPPTEGEG